MDDSVYTRSDFQRGPFVVFYEVTRACDLVCRHCRACAQPHRDPQELGDEQARRLIEQLATFPKRPLLVLTGGDPLKRPDVVGLVRHAVGVGLETAMTPSATPLVTREALLALRDAGLARLAVSLDGADPATHDGLRGVSGSFNRTLEIMTQARSIGLPVQINTTITRATVGQIDALAELLAGRGIVLWSVFFLVPVGRGEELARIEPHEYEQVFARLWHHAQRQPYAIKTTEAPHYRRFVLQRHGNPQEAASHAQAAPRADAGGARPRSRGPLGINDGKGVMFIDHTGRVFPSGFLAIPCGKFPIDSVVDTYQNSTVFRQLRDANQLQGKCGRCEYRHACGGSRARSYAVTGNLLAAEPDCVYDPRLARAGGGH